MDNRFRFTKGALLALEPPAAGARLTVYDTDVPKLALRMTHSGTRTFYVVKRAGTSMAWVKLGIFPEMTVERARAEAQKVLGEFASGADPAEARRAFKAEPTLAEFFAEYGARHGEKKRAWRDDQQRFRDYLAKPLGSRKLSEIAREQIARILSDAEKDGKSAATVRNIRALASGILAKAVEWGYLGANPAQGVKVAGRKVSRDRFLQADEMPRFFAALAEEPNDTLRDFILLALLTGARRSNLCAMHTRELDLAAGVWRIARTKNDEPQSVTLCPEAVAILEARKASVPSGFVFPGDGAKGHLVEPKKGVARVMERAGIPYGRDVENGVTLHDLRRTLGSWQARTGASMAIIGKSLNHKSHQATAIYARLDLDPVRQSVNTATSAMLEAGGLKGGAEVLPIKKGRLQPATSATVEARKGRSEYAISSSNQATACSIVGILEALNYFSDGRISIPELADALDSVLDYENMAFYRGDVDGLPMAIENNDSTPFLLPGEIRICDVGVEIHNSRFWVNPEATIVGDLRPSDLLVMEGDAGTIALLLWKFFLGGEEPKFWEKTLADFARGRRELFVGIDMWRSGGNSLKEELEAERKKTAELAAQVEQLKAQVNLGFLDLDHPRRSDKLAAAVLAWQALDDESLRHGKRAYSAAEDWLRSRSVELGLVHKRDNKRNNTKAGDVNGTAIEEVAKVVNWELDGGVPKTPCG